MINYGMDQNTGLNTMNLNAAIASMNTSGYGGFNSGQMTSMMSGLSNMASSGTTMNPMSVMGSDQYNPGQPYHQQTYQSQPASYQPQYAQQSQLQHYQPQQQPPMQYQRAYQHQPALPMTSSMSSLDSNTNGSNIDDRPPTNDYREFKEKTLDVCREFMRGFCNRNEERCKFAHPPPFVDVKDGKVIVCFDFTKNRCRRNQPPCRYMHPPSHLCPDFGNSGSVSSGTRRSGSRANDYGGEREVYGRRSNDGPRSYDRGPMYDDRYDGYSGSGSRRGGNGYGDSQWGPPPSRGGSRREERRETRSRSGSSWGYQGRYGDGPRSDQIEVCREYLRNNCDRQECRYAHPQSHVKVENGHVVYCIDHVVKGSCRKGDECRYFHMPRHLAIRYGKIDPRGLKRTYDEMRDDDRSSNNHGYSPRESDLSNDKIDMDREGSPHASESALDDNKYESFEEGKDVKKEHEEKTADVQFVKEAEGKTEKCLDETNISEYKVEDESFYDPTVEEPSNQSTDDIDDDKVKEIETPVEDENKEVGLVEDSSVCEEESRLIMGEVEATDEQITKEDQQEAYLEGPPQKRIALDADLVEEQQSS